MPSQETLVSVLQDLLPSYNDTFSKFNPAFQKITEAGGGIEDLESTHKEWILVSSDPGRFTEIQTSFERINGGRTQDSRRANAWPSFYTYAVDIGLQDLRKARGKRDMGQLIKSIPERSLVGIMEAVEQQFCMGNHPQLGGLPTLNGEVNYSPEGHTTQGIFEFAAPESQTGTIFGHARNSFQGWHTQYEAMSAMDQDGLRTIRTMNRKCANQGAAGMAGPKIWLADGVSFDNYLEVTGDRVIINDKQGSDPQAGQNSREGIPMGYNGAMLYNTPAFNLAGFNGTAQDGIMVGLDCSEAAFFRQKTGQGEFDGKDESKHKFLSLRDRGLQPGTDAIRTEYLLSLGLMMNQLRSSGAIVGSALR